MIKLQFSPPKFAVKNDGKITLCTYKCTKYETSTRKVLNTFTVTGKAILADGDTNNPKIGRILADSRAKMLAYKQSRLSEITKEFCRTQLAKLQTQIDFDAKMSYLYKTELEHIKSIKNEI